MDTFVQLAAAFVGSAGFSLLFNARGQRLLWGALGGFLSWGVYLACGAFTQNDPARYFLAALVLTFYAEIMARVQKTPVTVFLVAGTIPLIPGGGLYRTMGRAVAQQWREMLATGLTTLLLAVAIAGGILACTVLWHIGELAADGAKQLPRGR